MTASIPAGSPSRATRDHRRPRCTTRSLLRWGVVAGPFYVAVSVTLGVTRDGFDFTRHYWSLLTNGDLGWVQMVNYVLTGLMLVTFSVGLGRALRPGLAHRWGPVSVGVFGASLVVAGLFPTDPYGDFPYPPPLAGAQGTTGRGLLHFAALCVGSAAAAAACFVVAQRFGADGTSGLALFSRVTGVVLAVSLVLFIATFPGSAVNSVGLTAAMVLLLAWVATAGVHLYRPLADTS